MQPTKFLEEEPGMYPPVKLIPNSPMPTLPFDLYQQVELSDTAEEIELGPDDDEPLTDPAWDAWLDDFFEPEPYNEPWVQEILTAIFPQEQAIENDIDKKPGE